MSRVRPTTRLLGLAGTAILLATMTASPTAAAEPDTATESTQLIVRFRSGTTAVARRAATDRLGVKRVNELPTRRSTVVRVPAGSDVDQAIADLEADPTVLRVSVDHQRFLHLEPDDEPGWVEQWGFHNTGQRLYQGEPGTNGTSNVDIDALQALNIETGDPNVVVAVIDDGVDFSHPDLADREWTNPGEVANGMDDDGNGYVDDLHGWDFCDNDNTVHDFDVDYHGTHVAGTVAASLDGDGVVGVAPGITLMGLRFIDGTNDCGKDSQAIEAIEYAKSFGVRISNNSWGGRGSLSSAPELYDTIADSGMLFVSSAGNEGINNDTNSQPSLPASWDLPNIISVAAVDNKGNLAPFSNYGKTRVDISAPGVAILSTVPEDSQHGPSWTWLDGTSMAAPHVTGTAALVASFDSDLLDDPVALKARLLGSGKTLSKTAGKTATGDIVDAYKALDSAAPSASAPDWHGFTTGSSLGGASSVKARVSWPAATDDVTGVAAYTPGVSADGGSFTVLPTSSSRIVERVVSFGHEYEFRVRARDGAGNTGGYQYGPAVRPWIYQESTSLGSWTGSWGTSTQSAWSGGKTRYSSKKGSSATFTFTGRAFAIAAPKGPTRGSFSIYVDGVYLSTVSTYRSSTLSKVLVVTKTWTSSGPHTVKLVVSGTSGHSRVDVDALVVMK